MRPVVALRITPPQAAVGQEEQDYRLAPTPFQRAQQAFQPSWLPTPWSTKDLCLQDIKGHPCSPTALGNLGYRIASSPFPPWGLFIASPITVSRSASFYCPSH